jgi:hypothetical protein
MTADYMKCAYCEWKTKRWTSDRQGKNKYGGSRLLRHVETIHPDEYMKMFEKLDELYPPEKYGGA